MLLALALEGQQPLPFVHWIGQLSQEFGGALPSEILAEVDRLPAGMFEELLECRRFTEAWFVMKRTDTGADREALRGKGWTMFDLAEVIELELASAELAGHDDENDENDG